MRGDLVLLEAGFAALEQAVLVHDKDGRIVACNPAAAELAGRPVDEILGRRAGEYEDEIRYKDGTPVTAENSRLLRCIRTGEPERDVLVEVRDPDGRSRWVSASYQPLIYEGEREPWGAVASVVRVPTDASPYEALNDFSRQLQCILEAGDMLLYLKDLEGRYLFMNRRLGQVLGVRRDDATGRTDHEIRPAELADACVESDRRALESRSAIDVEERFETDGEVAVVRTIKFPLLDDQGEPYALAGVSADVTAIDRAQRDLRARLDGAPDALLCLDAEGRVSFANRAARAIAVTCDDLQLAIEEGERLGVLLGDDVTVEAAIDAGHPLSLQRPFERPDGSELWLAIEVAPLENGSGAMCSLRDVTREREREEELSHQAFHDSLTGLPNRRFTEEQLALGLARARRHAAGVGVVFADIDNFKRVNEELGHAAGDEVLSEFAERLTGALRESDSIGRLADPGRMAARRGGDEFVLVLTDLPADCGQLVAAVMHRVEAALEAPFKAGGRELAISASLGAAAYPYDSQDPHTLLELANAAMRAAKRRRREVRLSEPPDAG